MACQFFRAIWAAPMIPQRQVLESINQYVSFSRRPGLIGTGAAKNATPGPETKGENPTVRAHLKKLK